MHFSKQTTIAIRLITTIVFTVIFSIAFICNVSLAFMADSLTVKILYIVTVSESGIYGGLTNRQNTLYSDG